MITEISHPNALEKVGVGLARSVETFKVVIFNL
jgi:hypothetical protein